MKHIALIFAAFLAVAAVSVPSALAVAPPVPAINLMGTMVNVVDGDTADFEFRVVVRVRLLAGDGGCWADETHLQKSIADPVERKASRDRGLAAEKSLEDKALGKMCLVSLPLNSNRVIDYMTLERLLAHASLDGEDLGEYQVKNGHASHTKGGELGR